MKHINLNIISILIGFCILIAPFSAIADVTIPNTFTSGTPAVAAQVNENFQAFNTRQTATLASMAGTYTYNEVFFDVNPVTVTVPYVYIDNGSPVSATATSNTFSMPCIEINKGTMTLTSDGNVTGSATGTNSCGGNTSGSATGTFTVNADGSGTIILSGGSGTMTFKASKDLNTLLWWISGQPQNGTASGTAIRN